MRQDVDREPALRFDREGTRGQHLSSRFDRHRERSFRAVVGDLEIQCLRSSVETELRRCSGSHLHTGRQILTQMHNGQAGRLEKHVFARRQSGKNLELGDERSRGRRWLDPLGGAELKAVVKQPASRQRRDGQNVRALLQSVGRKRDHQAHVLRLAKLSPDRRIAAAGSQVLPALVAIERE